MNALYKIVSEVFEIDINSVNDESGSSDIEQWDSLGQMRLVVALESHYKVTFEVSEIFEIFKIGDIKRLLTKRGLI